MCYSKITMPDQPRLFEFDGSPDPIDAINKTDREPTPEENGIARALNDMALPEDPLVPLRSGSYDNSDGMYRPDTSQWDEPEPEPALQQFDNPGSTDNEDQAAFAAMKRVLKEIRKKRDSKLDRTQ
jgi:hypothetical protein